MPHKYEIKLVLDGSEVSLSGEFSDDQWKTLENFLDCADELRATRFVKEGNGGKTEISWTDAGMSVKTVLPDWDSVIVFLHKFRPILLSDENTNFYKVISLLLKQLDHPHVTNLLGRFRALYSGKRTQSAFTLSHDDVVINSERILLDWLNAYEYHRDRKKQEFIDSLHQMMPIESSKVLFLRLLAEKAQSVFYVAEIVRVVLGKRAQVSVTI